ncbi:TonB-dependent receptor domain-containing protein [Woeseia oceani]|uniref:TonB-dependent receptor n=1 Tax=Woeseia oceani TaxID=1548547 RepID=A0A193LJN3_9GAMM|nr:TonB-dependent receptor [Woeseia oceani]ANO52750.1 TonB-dependent receptor [Woeseia oceani]
MGAVHAQETSDSSDSDASMEEIMVTGSRVARSGYETQTPVTVINQETIESAAPTNLADFVNELPGVVGSSMPSTSNRSQSSGTAGVNSVNLRALGNTRTLVLLDGRRSVGSLSNGTVDINTFPQALVKSVEVVTGGASATYGSDAVSGVVNFILDHDYTGLKVDFNAGETSRGDDETQSATIGYGASFANDRGHLLLNGEVTRREGIYGVPRDWNNDGWYLVNNPDYVPGNGLPERLVVGNAGQSVMTPGGIITNTALRGTYFGVNSTVNQFAYGNTRDPWTIGGDWQLGQSNNTVSLIPEDDRDGVFAHLTYNITDSIEAFAEASYNKSHAYGWGGSFYDKGNVRIQGDNAFIPETVQQRMTDLGITEFTLGTSNGDLPNRFNDMEREVTRYVVGLNGSFSALGRDWSWDTYYQKGFTEARESVFATNLANLGMATDAVLDPGTGEIVCRSTLTDPGNGCIPFNRMGIGVNTPEAVDYVTGWPTRLQRFDQEVLALNFTTDVKGWVDPIGLAFGLEYRTEEISGSVEEQYQSGWRVGNYLPTFGEYDVFEGYVEALVPLPANLELSTAVRATDYSTSGSVTTWKVGLNWSVTDDVRLRLTKSRDIRAPGLSELFEAGRRRTNTLQVPNPADPGNPTNVQFTENVTGNPNLQPEEADSLGLGLVWRPSFVEGLGLSVDYYQIDINDAIGELGAQQIVDRCFEGDDVYCQAIDFGVGNTGSTVITELRNGPFNFVTETAEGIDLEMSYLFPMTGLPGDVTLSALATHYLEYKTDDGINPATDDAGENAGSGPPDWLYRISATYNTDQFTVGLTGRGVSDGVYNNSNIECLTGCPVSTSVNRTVNNNQIDGAFYTDLYMSHTLMSGDTETQLFFKVTNLFDRDPPIVVNGPSDSSQVEPYTNEALYDTRGRAFKLGVRFRW